VFIFEKLLNSLVQETADSHSQDQDASNDFDNDWRAYFEIPHWMHLSYVNYDNVNPKQPYTSGKFDVIASSSSSRFIPNTIAFLSECRITKQWRSGY